MVAVAHLVSPSPATSFFLFNFETRAISIVSFRDQHQINLIEHYPFSTTSAFDCPYISLQSAVQAVLADSLHSRRACHPLPTSSFRVFHSYRQVCRIPPKWPRNIPPTTQSSITIAMPLWLPPTQARPASMRKTPPVKILAQVSNSIASPVNFHHCSVHLRLLCIAENLSSFLVLTIRRYRCFHD